MARNWRPGIQTIRWICWILILCVLRASTAAQLIEEDSFFKEVGPLLTLSDERPRGGGWNPFLAYAPPLPLADEYFCYAPVDDIAAATELGEPIGEAHPLHVLTVFYPKEPEPGDRFPTLIFSPAGVFKGQPPDPVGGPYLLQEFVLNGWAVVTVGTTGLNSWPTCAQAVECANPLCMCGDTSCDGSNPPTDPLPTMPCNPGAAPDCTGLPPRPSACWDQNMYYDPSSGADEAWNDFNYFFGEKDFLWARQYIAEHSGEDDVGEPDEFFVDNDRIVVAGTSTGAHYAASLAFGPNRAWGTMLGGIPVSSQSQQDTRVAGLIMLEPVCWWPAFKADVSEGGVHFSRSDDPLDPLYRERTLLGGIGMIESIDQIERGSSSSWARADDATRLPVFIANGDGGFTTGFSHRPPSLFPNVYDRRSGSTASDQDPSIADGAFPVILPVMLLHDTWFALILREDLRLKDELFHNWHSRLMLRADTVWDDIHPIFWEPGVVAPLGGAEDITIVDDEYGTACKEGGSDCSSQSNVDLGGRIREWAERELCVETVPGVGCRNSGRNYGTLRTSAGVIGEDLVITVDASNMEDRYDHVGFLAFLDVGADDPLCKLNYYVQLLDQYVLVLDCELANGNLLEGSGPSGSNYHPIPPSRVLTFTAPIPDTGGFSAGDLIVLQACVYDLEAPFGGFPAIALTNAQDILLSD